MDVLQTRQIIRDRVGEHSTILFYDAFSAVYDVFRWTRSHKEQHTEYSMAQTTHPYEQFIERFVRWAEVQPDIGTAFVIGSQARITRPADAWSDLDLVVTVNKPERYLSEAHWLEDIGTVDVSLSDICR